MPAYHGFERKELWRIRARAEKQAEIKGLNSTWRRCYLALADAADHLDAMTARCTIGPPSPKTGRK